jgi:site-specific recombinase XerD
MAVPKSRVSNVRIRGPLAPVADEFRIWLGQEGYTPLTSVNKLRSLAHLSDWLEAQHAGVGELTDARVRAYLRMRRREANTTDCSLRALAPLLNFLAARGALPIPTPREVDGPVECLLGCFQRYLLGERGLATSTADAYMHRARRFLDRTAPDGDVGALTAAAVTGMLLEEVTVHSVGTGQYFVAAIRAFLRFCHAQGLMRIDLSGAALAITGRRHTDIPRGLARRDVDALLRACDRRQPAGRRDHAVLVTLLRLGLRATELAQLTLDDIDWRAAEVNVRGKGRRDERLPLPADVGAAIVGYLRRGRPPTDRREVFLSAIAPVHGLGRGGVSSIVRRACRRAGVTPVGAHRLRHTLACEMVRAGVPLPAIGQVLRHRGLSSTAVYARADVDQLRTLARAWPSVTCA